MHFLPQTTIIPRDSQTPHVCASKEKKAQIQMPGLWLQILPT